MVKKIITLIIIQLIIILSVSCEDGSKLPHIKATIKDEVEIKWLTHRTDFERTVLKDYKKEFEAANKGVKIIISTEKDYKDTLKMKMAANELPDVFSYAPNLYTKNQLMQSCLPVDDIPYANQFNCIDIFKGVDGKITGFPAGISSSAVVYNKKIFKEVGVKVPKTLPEFIETGKKIKAKGYIGLGMSAKDKWPLTNFYVPLATCISGDKKYINSMPEQDDPFSEGSPIYKAFSIANMLKDAKIMEDDPMGTTWEQIKKDFRAGKVGMLFLGPWFIPQAINEKLTEKDIGIFPFPYNDQEGPINVLYGPDYGWAMSKNSKYKDAQRNFFIFLTDKKYLDWASKTGALSARRDMISNFDMIKEFEVNKPKSLYSISESLKYSKIKQDIQLDEAIVIQTIVSGDKTVDQIAELLNKKWKDARAKNK